MGWPSFVGFPMGGGVLARRIVAQGSRAAIGASLGPTVPTPSWRQGPGLGSSLKLQS